MNLAEGESKGITSAKLLFFPVGAPELEDKKTNPFGNLTAPACVVLPGGRP